MDTYPTQSIQTIATNRLPAPDPSSLLSPRGFRVTLATLIAFFVIIVNLVPSSVAVRAADPTAREKIFPDGEFFEVDGHAAFILWPAETKKDSSPTSATTPWVFYAPTLSAYPDTHEEWMHRQFLAAGVAVAGIDAGEAYGSPESRKLFDRFYQLVTQDKDRKRLLAARPCLLGRSRGGLWVSSWAADHPERFTGLAGIYPVFDFRSYPGIDKAARSYKLSSEQLQRDNDSLNPIARADAFARVGLPVFIIHGDQDKVVPLEVNSAALASRYKALGHESAIQVKVATGQGHNFWEGFFRCQELVDFVIKQARSGARS